MKKILIFLLFATALASCGGDSNSGNVPEPDPQPQKGTATRPTEWLTWQEQIGREDAINTMYSMTWVLDNQGIEFDANANDIVAAFIGDECRGSAEADMQDDGTARFSLSVHLTNTDPDSNLQVTYRYYSAGGSKIYTYGPTAFVSSSEPQGSYSNPCHFTWKN